MLYYIEDFYTDEIITTTTSFSEALETCKNTPDSQVATEDDAVLYSNIELPF